jgi:hypothetical protein
MFPPYPEPVSKPAFSQIVRENGVSRCGVAKSSSNVLRSTNGMAILDALRIIGETLID